jgi:hypothetical protein
LFDGHDMCDISSALNGILRASSFSTILVFRNNLWSHIIRTAKAAMTDKILEQIDQTASKSVQGFKRCKVTWGGDNFTSLLLYMVLIKLAKTSVPMRVQKPKPSTIFSCWLKSALVISVSFACFPERSHSSSDSGTLDSDALTIIPTLQFVFEVENGRNDRFHLQVGELL